MLTVRARWIAHVLGAVLVLGVLAVPNEADAASGQATLKPSFQVSPSTLGPLGGSVLLTPPTQVTCDSISVEPALGDLPRCASPYPWPAFGIPANEGKKAIVYKFTYIGTCLYGCTQVTLHATLTETALTGSTYVALGDSYASGEGNPNADDPPEPWVDKNGNPTAGDECDRSSVAYPVLMSTWLKKQKDLPSTNLAFLACSGATTEDVTGVSATGLYGPSGDHGESTPQLGDVRDLSSARVVTITIGGDDLNFHDVLTNCSDPLLHTCNASSNDGWIGDLSQNIQDLEPVLVSTYEQVEAAAPNAALYVVGYPDIFPTSPSPSQLLGCNYSGQTIPPSGITYLATNEFALDEVVSKAASLAGAHFVDPNSPTAPKSFLGHTVCSKHPWINLPNPTYVQSSYHPNAQGLRALAADIAAVVKENSTPTGSLANTVRGFSDVQGQNGWSYGYYANPPNPTFTPMTTYEDPADLQGTVEPFPAWVEDSDTYWTLVSQEVQHPESVTTSGTGTPTNQWSVRRWTSSHSGPVTITGWLSKQNTGCGDGVRLHVLINGDDVSDISIVYNDAVGRGFSVAATLAIGSTVDFALDPISSDWCDGSNVFGFISPTS